MPSALSAHEWAFLKRQIRRHQFARPFKWNKSPDQILASVKRLRQKAQQTLCGEL